MVKLVDEIILFRKAGDCMWTYTAKKILVWIPILAIALYIPFMALIHLTPGPPFPFALGGGDGALHQVHEWREYYGFNQTPSERYIRYILSVFRGEFSPVSVFGRGGHDPSITPMVMYFSLYTIRLIAISLSASLALAIPIGAMAAARKNAWTDKIIRAVALIGSSMPIFVLGMILVILLFHPVASGWRPHLVVSSIALGFSMFCVMALSVRSTCLKVIGQDYITAVRAKGLVGNKIIFKHVLRNALPPVLSTLQIQLGAFFSGVIIIEFLSHRPGIGRLLMQGILSRDYALALACVVMFVFCYVVIHILIDITQGLIDPRVREQGLWAERVNQ